MEAGTKCMRPNRSFVMSDLKTLVDLNEVVA
jgi:hypothetical protein